MKLASPDWNNTLDWDVHHAGCLVLEDPDEYRQVISDLTQQADNREGKLVISIDGEPCSLAKEGLLIRDLWSVDINQKKILTAVQKQLVEIGQEDYYTDVMELIIKTETLVEKVAEDSMLPLCWECPADLGAFMKVFGVRLETTEEPLDRLLDYVRLAREFLHSRFLILTGIRNFLTDDTCAALQRDFTAFEIPVLFIEHTAWPMLEHEHRLVIDTDHCELLLR